MSRMLAAEQKSAPSRDEIPVLDLADYRAGNPDALERLAAELRHALEQVGFYFVRNHGVAPALIDRVFADAARFHALPLDEKLALKINEHNIGYMAMKSSTTRSSAVNVNTKPNVNEAFFVKRERAPDDPAVRAGKRYKGLNQWPHDLPGFRATCIAYCAALEGLALSLLPAYARALDLPADGFAKSFVDPQFTLRLSHYPPAQYGDNEFGSAPHTDSSFMTILAQNRIAGLEIRTPSGAWLPAPPLDGTFLVNSGDLMRRWTNDRFRSTPHRVRNLSGVDRYAIPFFFDANAEAPIECLPTCRGPGNPPKYETTTYTDYMIWFSGRNYNHVRGAPDYAA
jgi:isopenicillin N synthase-like dioxygenase